MEAGKAIVVIANLTGDPFYVPTDAPIGVFTAIAEDSVYLVETAEFG